jgi:tetratricopeptide (TPR) repeat protein
MEKILTINARPIANFTLDPPNPEEGIEITFDASSSKDPDGQISYYWWDLDESKTDGKRASYVDHKYKIPGEYNVTLMVSDNRSATNSMTRIIRIHPPNVNKLMQEGQVLINENRYQDAIYKFDSVLQQEPLNGWASFYRGFSLNKMGKFGDALESLNDSLAANPSNSYAWNEKANALHGLGRYEEALSSNNKSIEVNPEVWSTWYDRGILLYDMDEFEGALNAYDNALSLNPGEDDKRDIMKMKGEASAKALEPAHLSGIAGEPPLAEKCSIDVTASVFKFSNSTSVSFYGGESESAKQIRYKITVINKGDVSLHDVTATAEMAKGMKFYNAAYYEIGRGRLITEVSPSVFDETTKTKVTWNIEHLQANEIKTILMNAYLKEDMHVDNTDISVNASGVSSVCGLVWAYANKAEIQICEQRGEFGDPCSELEKELGLCKLACPEWIDQSI